MSAVPSTGVDVPPSDDRLRPSDDRLREALREVLARAHAGEPASVSRSRSVYRSSFPLEELSVTLADGSELRMVLKRLERGGLSRDGRLAKPSFLFDARREAAVYSSILPAAPAGPPRYFGSVPAEAGAGCWLFIEWVQGRELYQVGELSLWVQVARWLGELHASLAVDLERHVREGRLLEYDAAHYRRWLARAREFATLAGRSSESARFLDWLAARHDVPVEALLELGRTVVHGDFYASNVLVAGEAQAVRVAPVDWELAAAGPGLMDLAALISGNWTDMERREMTDAYASRPGIAPFSATELDFARLQLAVQWLGWAPPHWVAPEGQRHDWLAEAVVLAQRLDI
jgi:aminoglycoside phosphotransferase (APT) family kinase protein